MVRALAVHQCARHADNCGRVEYSATVVVIQWIRSILCFPKPFSKTPSPSNYFSTFDLSQIILCIMVCSHLAAACFLNYFSKKKQKTKKTLQNGSSKLQISSTVVLSKLYWI